MMHCSENILLNSALQCGYYTSHTIILIPPKKIITFN